MLKTPRIVEATTERSKVFDLPAAGELVKEGYLLAKTAVADGKRASDRSWKPYWILLRGHCLYLFKDKAAANTVSRDKTDVFRYEKLSFVTLVGNAKF